MPNRILITLGLLISLSACGSHTETKNAWNGYAYVDQMQKPTWGTMKSLQSPGFY